MGKPMEIDFRHLFDTQDPMPSNDPAWQATADGVVVPYEYMEFDGLQYGGAAIGTRTDGTGKKKFRAMFWGEPGSAVVAAWAMIDDQLHVALVLENRPNLGGLVWCAIGGAQETGRTALFAAMDELDEESGIKRRPVQLPGNATAAIRGFQTIVRGAKGTSYFALEFKPEELEAISVAGGRYRLKAGLNGVDDSRAKNVAFMPWKEAVMSVDGIVGTMVARLMAHLSS